MNHPISEDINVLARETAGQMLARLSLVTLKPARILDADGGAGEMLKKQYPDAEIVTSTNNLPDNSIDLLFANLVLPWCSNVEIILREWQRILRPEGLLMLTSFGPDTLREVQERDVLLPYWIDMHDLGDKLAEVGFADPVLDVEHFTLTYREHKQLLYELQITKMIAQDQMTLTVEKNTEGVFPLTYEVIYGHAWGAETRTGYHPDETGTVKIPLADLRRRL